ncbi:MAG: Crp/Fnr family transcriptional regulator [Planctomycetes bacterium]|nr:Crp/Fnr family transcriptional regulator [Planctomycetota bacterium]
MAEEPEKESAEPQSPKPFGSGAAPRDAAYTPRPEFDGKPKTARRLRDGNERWRALIRFHGDLSERTAGHARRFYESMERVLRAFSGRESMANLLSARLLTRAYECGKIAAKAPRAAPSASESQELALLGPPAGAGGSGDLSPAGSEGVRLIERDGVLFRQGEPGAEFHVVLEGRLQVEIDHREILVVEKGGIVGEMAVLLDDPVRTATVRALEPTRVLVVPRDRLQEIVDQMPWILLRLVHALANRLRNSNETIAGCRREGAEGLLFFADLAREYGTLAENLASYRVKVVDLVEELRASQAEIERAREEFAARLDGLFARPPGR